MRSPLGGLGELSAGASPVPERTVGPREEQLRRMSVSSKAEVLSLGTSPRASPKPSNPHPLTGPCWDRTPQLPLRKPKAGLESFKKPLNGAEGCKSARPDCRAADWTGAGM